MKYCNSIKFDEDLVLIVTSYLKYNGIITKEIILLFKEMFHYIKKNEGISLDTFEFFNYFVINGICKKNTNNLSNFKIFFEEILNSFIKFLNYGWNDKAHANLSHFFSYNLFLILIQVI